MRFAYLSSTVTLPGSPDRRSDAFEHDQMMEELRAGLISSEVLDGSWEDVAWDDGSVDWAKFDAVMIGTAWDYWDRQAEFLSTLQSIAGQTRLYNSTDLVIWNSHKAYLRDLGARGAPLISTIWLDDPKTDAVDAVFGELETEKIVLKRQVGAGADGQHLLTRSAEKPELLHPMMAQPFLSAIVSEGELSFIFVDGDFSHALIKRAASGDYRIQSTYGGTEQAITPEPEDLADASRILTYLDEVPLYARVDMLRAEDGDLLLMELELIEPYLYPLQGEGLGARLAKALLKRIQS
ncbi:MAG: hypothetical protein AAF950_13315 [Pseudomonadota bacterium]